MTTKALGLNRGCLPASSLDRAMDLLAEKWERGIQHTLPESLQLPASHLSNFLLAPGIYGTKILYHGVHACLHAASLPISLMAILLSCGICREARQGFKRSFLSIFEHIGEAILSGTSFLFAESLYLTGLLLHPEMPARFLRQ